MSTLADISIAIPSFLRLGYLFECLRHIMRTLPECQVIVADDSIENPSVILDYQPIAHIFATAPLRQFLHTASCVTIENSVEKKVVPVLRLPFDSGLPAKRNAIVSACQTKYLLLFCDDFKADAECRAGVLRLIEVLDQWSYVALATGRVDNREYEASLDYSHGSFIREIRSRLPMGWNQPLTSNGRPAWHPIDLAANYFLARTEVLKQFPWPEEMKIGGEHVCLFLDLKLADSRRDIPSGYHSVTKVVSVAGVNVKTMTLGPEAKDPRYDAFRGRAYELGHAAMKRRYNIQQYIGMAGDVS